jgi:hypothetical protein
MIRNTLQELSYITRIFDLETEFPLLLLFANAGFAMTADDTSIPTAAIARIARVVVFVIFVVVFILLYSFR